MFSAIGMSEERDRVFAGRFEKRIIKNFRYRRKYAQKG